MSYLFDPELLHAVARKYVGLPHDEMVPGSPPSWLVIMAAISRRAKTGCSTSPAAAGEL